VFVLDLLRIVTRPNMVDSLLSVETSRGRHGNLTRAHSLGVARDTAGLRINRVLRVMLHTHWSAEDRLVQLGHD